MNSRFVIPLFIVAILVISSTYVGSVSPTKAQTGPPPTSNITVRDGANAGEIIVSWVAVPAATHYRIGYVNMEVDYHLVTEGSCTMEPDDWIQAFVYVDVKAPNIPVRDGRAEYTIRRLSPGARHAFTVLTSNNFVDSGGGGSVHSEFFWPSTPRWSFLAGRDSLPNWHPDSRTGLFRASRASDRHAQSHSHVRADACHHADRSHACTHCDAQTHARPYRHTQTHGHAQTHVRPYRHTQTHDRNGIRH